MTDEKRPGGAPVDEPPTNEEEAAAAALRRALEAARRPGRPGPRPRRPRSSASAAMPGPSRPTAPRPCCGACSNRRRPRPPAGSPHPLALARTRGGDLRRRRRADPGADPGTAEQGAARAVRPAAEGPVAAARGGPAARAALEQEMAAYRERMYATLGKRYLRGR
ncbi:MAG: hypothetical protein MZV49_26290 [Rhodopseudomonas palustris]|nr:hypothetical protein [Rhodopseudomonas palustris]